MWSESRRQVTPSLGPTRPPQRLPNMTSSHTQGRGKVAGPGTWETDRPGVTWGRAKAKNQGHWAGVPTLRVSSTAGQKLPGDPGPRQ